MKDSIIFQEPSGRDCISEFYKLKQRLCLTKEERENVTMNPNFIRRKWRINEVQT